MFKLSPRGFEALAKWVVLEADFRVSCNKPDPYWRQMEIEEERNKAKEHARELLVGL
jgi:hypothetical protein